MPEIRVERPGKLIASGDNVKNYTFLIVLDKPSYTAASLAANPVAIPLVDLIFRSPAVPDLGGKATLDLTPHAEEINRKLAAAVTKVKMVVVAAGADPNARLADVQPYDLRMAEPFIELKTTPESLKKILFGDKAKITVSFKNVDSVELTVEPAGSVTLSDTSVTREMTVDVVARKDAKVTLTARGLWGKEAKVTKKLEFESEGLAPGVRLEKPAAMLGAEVKLTLEGPAGEEYTLVLTPQAAAQKGGAKPVEKKSPFGKLSDDGGAKGALVLDAKEFRDGKYDVVLRTAGGKESPKAELDISVREWRYDFSDPAQMKDWQNVGNPASRWSIQGGVLQQLNPASGGNPPNMHLLGHVPSRSPRRFLLEASMRMDPGGASPPGHAGIHWSFADKLNVSLLYVRTAYGNIQTTAFTAGKCPPCKEFPHASARSTWYRVRVEVDVDARSARLVVDGKDFGTWGAPHIGVGAGSLGLWSEDLSSYKDIHIKVLDPGEPFPPP